jgi:hypothetical protein
MNADTNAPGDPERGTRRADETYVVGTDVGPGRVPTAAGAGTGPVTRAVAGTETGNGGRSTAATRPMEAGHA